MKPEHVNSQFYTSLKEQVEKMIEELEEAKWPPLLLL
jgi:hypothetical protein